MRGCEVGVRACGIGGVLEGTAVGLVLLEEIELDLRVGGGDASGLGGELLVRLDGGVLLHCGGGEIGFHGGCW